jgi:uncharacterized protein Yka (UPF0111/DUF47 family)
MRISFVPRPRSSTALRPRRQNALEAARLAQRRFREFPNASVTQADVKAVEAAGDQITHDIIQLLNTQYITPFDREDIYELATTIDDVVDHIEEASTCSSSTTSTSRHGAPSISATSSSPRPSSSPWPWRAQGLRGVQDALVEVKRREDEGDRLVREAIGSLFQTRASTRSS